MVTNLGMTNATQYSKSDVMFTLALILDFAMETLPNDSSFWNLPFGLIEGILSAGATLALGITMYSGDPGAWYPAIMSLLMLLFSLFI